MSSKLNEWLEWRLNGIGSSDAPVLMGHYDYCTPFQLWEEKARKVQKEDKINWAMNKGNEFEPIARAKYELQTSLSMPAGRFEHYEFQFLRATMDGYNVGLKKGIEIKYVGKEFKAIPDKHKAQMQHQFLVTGAKEIDYVAITDDKNIHIRTCYPDQTYIMAYLLAAMDFWNRVQNENPPDLVDKDIRKIKGHDALALQYIEAKKILDKASKDVEKLKKDIENIAAGIVRAEFGKTGLQIVKVYRSGNIDYSKIEVLKDINLDAYRKPSTSYFKISESI